MTSDFTAKWNSQIEPLEGKQKQYEGMKGRAVMTLYLALVSERLKPVISEVRMDTRDSNSACVLCGCVCVNACEDSTSWA